jgi:hypothetical protein
MANLRSKPFISLAYFSCNGSAAENDCSRALSAHIVHTNQGWNARDQDADIGPIEAEDAADSYVPPIRSPGSDGALPECLVSPIAQSICGVSAELKRIKAMAPGAER